MGFVTTCSVGVDLDTITTLPQSISTFSCFFSCEPAGIADAVRTTNTNPLQNAKNALCTNTPSENSSEKLEQNGRTWQTISRFVRSLRAEIEPHDCLALRACHIEMEPPLSGRIKS